MNAKLPDAPPTGPRARVLVVDDNELNVTLVRMLLSADFQVSAAGDAQQALTMAANLRPQLVLLDLELPDIDGLTLARRLKSHADTKDIPIVVLTAHAAEDVETAVAAAGCAGLLTKPIDPGTFTEAVRLHLTAARNAP